MVTHVLSHGGERFANFDVILIRKCHFDEDVAPQCSRYGDRKRVINISIRIGIEFADGDFYALGSALAPTSAPKLTPYR
jgi:hypothetical protein